MTRYLKQGTGMHVDDIHTHADKPSAIISCSFPDFSPKEGRLYSVGIHPWQAASLDACGKNGLRAALSLPQVVAVGEAGLDKMAGADWPVQEEAFLFQANLAEETGKPLVIHSVRSSNELVNLKRRIGPSVPWIVHGFRGNANVARQFLSHGFYLSFGEHFQQEALCAVPLERLFAETDESRADIGVIYREIALAKGVSEEQLRRFVQENIRHVFFER